MKLKLKKFDLSRIADDKVVLLCARRGCGKSFIIRDILYHHRDIPIGTIISATEESNAFFSDFVPKSFIHYEYTADKIDNVIKRQKMIIKEKKKEIKRKGYSNIDERIVVCMDDCVYNSGFTRDNSIRNIFMNGRHFKIFYIISSQYSLSLPPVLRTNLDFIFILKENNWGNRKRLYENFGGCCPSFDIFCTLLDKCTENFECLVIDNTSKSNKLEDIIFWFKASERKDFKLGASQFWINNNVSDSESDNEDFDPSRFTSRKKTIDFDVKKLQY